jgi:hypothetical protein
VFLEALNVNSMIQQNGNSRNIAAMSWYETPQAFKPTARRTAVTWLLLRLWNDEEMCAVWCRVGEAVVGARALVHIVQV